MLTLRDVSDEVEGEYQCIVSNHLGLVHSRKAHITVYGEWGLGGPGVLEAGCGVWVRRGGGGGAGVWGVGWGGTWDWCGGRGEAGHLGLMCVGQGCLGRGRAGHPGLVCVGRGGAGCMCL